MKTRCQSIEDQIQSKTIKMGWTCSENGNITKCQKCLRWNPPGKRKRARPKMTLRRSVEAELKDMGMTWSEAERLGKDRTAWR